MMLWITRKFVDIFPAMNNPIVWKITPSGDFIFAGLKALHIDSDQLLGAFTSDNHIDSAHINERSDFICRLSDHGWTVMCADSLAISSETIVGEASVPIHPTIDPSENLLAITMKYLDYRYYDRNSCRKQVSVREDTHNPVYLQWYAYSYAQRWLHRYNDGTRELLARELLSQQQSLRSHLQARYILAHCVLLPQIISAPRQHQCHYSEQIAQLLLQYVPFMAANDSNATIAQLGVHALTVMMGLSGILPLQLI